MEPEKKVETLPPAPAQGADQKVVTPPAVEKKAAGLDGFTTAELKDFYSKSPQMFEDAGIVPKKEEEKKVVPPVEEKKEVKPPPAVSAAPKYGDDEIKIPSDVTVNPEAVTSYFAHAKEIGLTAKQVQAEIDFQVKQAREQEARQKATQPQKTPQQIAEEQDAANVAKLKADKEFGAKYEDNMAIARKAAVKYGDAELLERLKTSDPVLVRHLWKVGMADAEDSTGNGPNRTGNETEDAEQSLEDQHKQRFPNSPGMFKK